jgi:hypothetical protein
MPVKPDTTPGRTGNCIAPVYLVPFATARAGYCVTLIHLSVTPKRGPLSFGDPFRNGTAILRHDRHLRHSPCLGE